MIMANDPFPVHVVLHCGMFVLTIMCVCARACTIHNTSRLSITTLHAAVASHKHLFTLPTHGNAKVRAVHSTAVLAPSATSARGRIPLASLPEELRMNGNQLFAQSAIPHTGVVYTRSSLRRGCSLVPSAG